ncbi:hypothetical protein HPB48_014247 [Haemaphysalis longicornis]|uniref:Uncharacterized protein n=1 Tax=Haemaphysalis longicornis TaxID=44386 RepID=A0A9J6FJ53_HAELO|nr:hypothetical protein HPB48_014247 [Haemaphysalis longicornis]
MCAAAQSGGQATAASTPTATAVPQPSSEEDTWEATPIQPPVSWGEEREVFAYLLTLMAVFTAVITLVHNINDKGVSPKVLGPATKLSSTETPRAALSPYDLCMSRSCQAEGRFLVSLLTWEYDPCENFYAFVCHSFQQERESGDVLLRRDLELRLTALLRRPSPSPVLEPLRRLYSQCNQPDASRDLRDLHQALTLAELPDWPYAVPLRHPVSAWSAAAQVFKLTGAETLLSVAPGSDASRPGQNLVQLGTPNLGSPVSREALSAVLGAFRPRLLVPLYAAEVSAFERRLQRCRPSAVHLARLAGYPQLAQFLGRLLGGSVHEGTEALLQTDSLRAVIVTVVETPVETVLNMMGLRMLLRLAYFLPDNLGLRLADSRGPRWRGCLLQLEPALPQLFLLASIEAVGVTPRASRLAEDVRRALVRSLAGLSWLKPGDRRQAAAFLARTRIRLFMPDELRNGSAPAAPPQDLDGGLLAFCKLHARAIDQRLRSPEPWLASVFDSDCILDVQANRVDVPLLMFNRSAVALDDLQSSQLPRAGFRLARCFLRLLFSSAETDSSWDEGVRARRCLARHYGTMPTLAPLEDSLALDPVLRLFRDNLRTRRRLRHDLRLRNAEDLSLDQLFFIYFALPFCNDGTDAERRTNVALWNTPAFHTVYECRTGSPMRPEHSCVLWVSL